MKILWLLFFLGSFYSLPGQVMSAANDITDYYLRYRNLKMNVGDKFYRDFTWIASDSTDFIGSAPKVKELGNRFFQLPLKWDTYYNTTYAKSYNNGAVWSGRGLTSSMELGWAFKNDRWELTVYPIFFWSQNREYDVVNLNHTIPRSEYSYAWSHMIDLPQRFGNESILSFNPGNSKIQYTFKNNLYLRISNESLWWGPSYRNPVLMSNNAAGVPHFAFGSDEKIKFKYGKFGLHLIWGGLSESKHFDNVSNNDHRFFTALNISWDPWFADNLELGLGRILQRIWNPSEMGFKDYVAMIIDPERRLMGNNSTHDQIAIAYIRWRFPSEGFEVFSEFGRYDWGGDFKNFVVQHPDHTLIYSIGFSKLFPTASGDIRFLSEFNALSKSRLAQNRIAPILYEHFRVVQGYTQRGEALGAYIGPGSTNQMIRIDVFKEKTVTSYTLNRSTLQDDAFFALEADLTELDRIASPEERDIELSVSFSHYRNFKNSQVGLEMGHYVRDNMNFINDTYNLYLLLSVKKSF